MNDYELSAPEGGPVAGANQYLIFSLAGEKYGVPVLNVQEIKGNAPVTRVPNLPVEVMGVLNLRGAIVQIIDLRRKFGLPGASYDQFAAIVVLVVQGLTMGMIVDSVSEVVSVPEKDVQLPARFTSGVESAFLHGLAKIGDDLVILLNIETALLGGQELAAAA
jgi:purine-binding chemotaxis protein CheW